MILRLHYHKLLREPHVRSRHFTKSLSEVGNDFGSGSFPFGNQAGLFFGGCHRISLRLDVVADRPSPLKTSRDLRSAAGRCEPAHRDLTFAIAEVWLLLARQQEAMVELLAIWSEFSLAVEIAEIRQQVHGHTPHFTRWRFRGSCRRPRCRHWRERLGSGGVRTAWAPMSPRGPHHGRGGRRNHRGRRHRRTGSRATMRGCPGPPEGAGQGRRLNSGKWNGGRPRP
jgi:hypothetical protein